MFLEILIIAIVVLAAIITAGSLIEVRDKDNHHVGHKD